MTNVAYYKVELRKSCTDYPEHLVHLVSDWSHWHLFSFKKGLHQKPCNKRKQSQILNKQ